MKNYPKHLNTKQDVLNVMSIDKAKTEKFLQNCIDNYYGWNSAEKLETKEKGIEDDTHRVRTVELEEETVEFYQEEYGILKGNKLTRLGFSLEEAESLISK